MSFDIDLKINVFLVCMYTCVDLQRNNESWVSEAACVDTVCI